MKIGNTTSIMREKLIKGTNEVVFRISLAVKSEEIDPEVIHDYILLVLYQYTN